MVKRVSLGAFTFFIDTTWEREGGVYKMFTQVDKGGVKNLKILPT